MNGATVVNEIDFRDLIFVTDNNPVTDSYMVARVIGKRPDNIIRDIEETIIVYPKIFIQNSV